MAMGETKGRLSLNLRNSVSALILKGKSLCNLKLLNHYAS